MSKFRAARNQIHTSLVALDMCGEEYRAEMEEAGRKIFYGGIIEPYCLERAQFSTVVVAEAAAEMCLEHHHNLKFKVVNGINGQYAINTFRDEQTFKN